MNCRVSVILSTHNAADTLGAAIKSVLGQSFSDFEFIIIDDASDDASGNILADAANRDKRIIIIRNESNIGLTKSLNKGINIARGEYIARIDAGDLWNTTKLEKQIVFLGQNQDYSICGTQAFYIDGQGKVLGRSSYSGANKDIKMNFFTREGIFFHPSIVFRNTGIKYRDFFRYSQDLDLYMRLFFKGKFYCLPEPLISSRFSLGDLTMNKRYFQRQYSSIIYRLFKERMLSGTDSLDTGKQYVLYETKLGLKLCSWSKVFIFKYIKNKISSRRSLAWVFWLSLAMILYPPYIKDYGSKLMRVVLYKKLKILKINDHWLD